MKSEVKVAITTVDDYIAMFPETTQKALRKLRQVIRKAAPEAEEVISYAMPGYKQNGVAIWFAAYKNHYAVYVRPKIHEAFLKELASYKQTKSAVHFSYNSKLPEKLIAAVTKYAIAENLEDVRMKAAQSKKNDAGSEAFSALSVPARRALGNHGIQNLKQLSKYSEAAILALHGMGKSSIPKLKNELEKQNLSFKK